MRHELHTHRRGAERSVRCGQQSSRETRVTLARVGCAFRVQQRVARAAHRGAQRTLTSGLRSHSGDGGRVGSGDMRPVGCHIYPPLWLCEAIWLRPSILRCSLGRLRQPRARRFVGDGFASKQPAGTADASVSKGTSRRRRHAFGSCRPKSVAGSPELFMFGSGRNGHTRSRKVKYGPGPMDLDTCGRGYAKAKASALPEARRQ